ncbi:plastid division protein PDV2-like [Rutidosis leptorrhynchoides]|uniref:plastid division protein PDV2-like n=1 Tax=Rutidosis leptorrhynchoides TaxID=125765 RepID=UPI003A997D19
MDEEGLAMVLSRASVLRSKMTDFIENSSYRNLPTQTPAGTANPEYEDDEEITESLIAIRYSLQNFEADLSYLLGFEERQLEEKEILIGKVDYSLKRLLEKIKEYEGIDLEIIHEANAFASSTEMNIDDLLSQNDHPNGYPEGSVVESKSRIPFKGLGKVIGALAKTVFTCVGFIAVTHFSGFEFRCNKRGTEFNVLGMAQERENEETVVEGR